tara:strand:+ start:24 stop:251 length:228 start_codon:yes stop_codon:yes gene_type:complete
MTDKEDPSEYSFIHQTINHIFPLKEKVADVTPGDTAAAGGLDDDDVWGDVEDVSKFKICGLNQRKWVLTKKYVKY